MVDTDQLLKEAEEYEQMRANLERRLREQYQDIQKLRRAVEALEEDIQSESDEEKAGSDEA